MTDKELLELAAKAAGYDFEKKATVSIKDGKRIYYIKHTWWDNEGRERHDYWNPLTDDGDALRLAVKLGFVIDSHGMWMRVGEPYSDALAHEQKGDDPYAATRRAIVRAAAEIGKNV